MPYSQPIPPQTPRAPEVSLVTSADSFPPSSQSYDQWRSGIAAQELLCLEAANEPADCITDADDERWDPQPPSTYDFVPVHTYLPYACEGFVGDRSMWDKQAQDALDAKLAFNVARELWTGEQTGNPSLQSTAVLLPTDGALSPTAGAMMGLAAYEECTQGAQAFVHSVSSTQDAFEARMFFRRVGNKFVTTKGHVVVLGPGYPQSAGAWGPTKSYVDGDIVEGDPAEAGPGEAFLYVTGPVQYAGPQTTTVPITQQPRRNRHVSLPSVASIFRFDPCCAFAVLVRIPDNSAE